MPFISLNDFEARLANIRAMLAKSEPEKLKPVKTAKLTWSSSAVFGSKSSTPKEK